ncbi:NAD(P)-binding domain protein [Ophiocordyceps camponoti-floridani]|uniref:NAD(P)-binding domain protein n=1 Tax=Ophiocordyceps camponoti-floridani TaxID=2030778 RepID=A0A8H4Q1D6_9HYPO|nr:NAD(P)-binding domain protein [Ophiocordyceps camponoti-floridani]
MAPSAPATTLKGKVALVTGAGRGLGRGIAIELGKRGASVAVNYCNTDKAAQEVVKEIEAAGSKAVAIKADVSKLPDIERLFEETVKHFGGLDIVMSNSGRVIYKKEDQVTEEDFDNVFTLNTRGQFFVAQQALKHCREGGRIILTSSVAANLPNIGAHSVYAGSKAAVEAFVRSYAVICGPKKITINAVAPGGVKTDMFTENAWNYVQGADPSWPVDKIEKGLADLGPLKRVAEPIDIARIVAFLAHDDSEWINGQTILLTGGSTA